MTEKDKINARRRRKGDGVDDSPRATAPSRKRSEGSRTPGSSQTGVQRPTTSGKMKLPLWLVIPLVILVLLFNLFTGGNNDSSDGEFLFDSSPSVEETEIEEVPVNQNTPTREALEVVSPAEGDGDQVWLVMLYQDADDKVLEQDIFIDLNEAEKVGSTNRVHIVAQVDRHDAGYSGDGNWTSARRYYVTHDDDLESLSSPLIQELGEVNMADGQSLVDFVSWSVSNYPADKHVLILSDHGMGWPGGWSDPSPGGKDPNDSPLASKLGDHLFLSEIDLALDEIRQLTEIDKFEIIGFDACLMAQLEVFSTVAPHANYAIASEETEPALGWAYTGFLQALSQNPDMDGEGLSRLIIDSYIRDDQRITDPVARESFISQGSPLAAFLGFGRTTSEQLTQQIGRDVTLSAVDLNALPMLMEQVNNFSIALEDEDQSVIASARNYARSFTSIFGREVPPSFIDLGHFVQLVIREAKDPDVRATGESILDVLGRVVVAEKHGKGKSGSSGISIYFPNSTLYRSPLAGPQSYTMIATRFVRLSLWDDFLAYHYQNRPIDPNSIQPYVSEEDIPTRAPGSGKISVSSISVSSQVAAPGMPVTLEMDISGTNIGYIKLFVGYVDQTSNSIFYADTDYLESPTTLELNGVYYPKWSDNETFTLSFEWDPYIFGISNGQKVTPALFSPRTYGASSEDAIYTVDGIYNFQDNSESLNARLYFRDGILSQVFGFTGQEDLGAPREIIPQNGDSFTILDQWLDLDESGDVAGSTYIPGETITFTQDTFRWDEIYAAQGIYVVGFIIEDFDGNATPVYTQVIVE